MLRSLSFGNKRRYPEKNRDCKIMDVQTPCGSPTNVRVMNNSVKYPGPLRAIHRDQKITHTNNGQHGCDNPQHQFFMHRNCSLSKNEAWKHFHYGSLQVSHTQRRVWCKEKSLVPYNKHTPTENSTNFHGIVKYRC